MFLWKEKVYYFIFLCLNAVFQFSSVGLRFTAKKNEPTRITAQVQAFLSTDYQND
jgi:hypothetical protein